MERSKDPADVTYIELSTGSKYTYEKMNTNNTLGNKGDKFRPLTLCRPLHRPRTFPIAGHGVQERVEVGARERIQTSILLLDRLLVGPSNTLMTAS